MRKIASILYRNPVLLFVAFVCIAYLPVLLPFFHLKNDLITQNLPTRFIIGESLYSGFEPFWNPYIHFGIPQYGDMNNGFWNPIQWIIASTIGYSIYSITLEEMFYVFLGGWGIYKIVKELCTREIALLTGLAYICSGYIVGHLQYLCWITGTAFFPFVLLYFIRVHKSPVLKNFAAGGISVFLFVASTHPGLIIGAIYFFAFLLLFIYFNRKYLFTTFYKPGRFWQISFLFALVGSLLSLVVIVSNIDVLSHISRGTRVSLEQTLLAPTTLQSYLSLLLPLPVHKSGFFNTDIAMRNVYIGLVHLAGLILFARYFPRRIVLFAAIPLLFFILLSAGGPFKVFAWKFLPLTGFVRLNGEFTYFTTLILLACGATGLQRFYTDKSELLPRKYAKAFAWLFASLALTTGPSVSFVQSAGTGIRDWLKSAIDNTSFWDLFFVQALIQLVSILLLRMFASRKAQLLFTVAFNFIVITWLTLPYTGLGSMSKKEVQSVLNTFPRGIPPQELVSINDASYISSDYWDRFMLVSSYSKKIGYTNRDQYPVQLARTSALYSDTALYSFIKKQSFIFLSSDTTVNSTTTYDSSAIRVIRCGPGYVECIVDNDNFQWLTFLQNDYPGWKVSIDGIPAAHFTGFKTFIAVPLRKGTSTVIIEFIPTRIKTAMWITITLLAITIAVILVKNLGVRNVFK